MPITPPPQVPNLVNPNGVAPFTQQYNFGQALGSVASFCPDVSLSMIQNFLNDGLREWTDRRMWYGNLQKGQVLASGMYSTGTVQLTYNSASVQGIGTNWTQSLNGVPITQQSFRAGYYAPIYNIVALDQSAQVLTLELPWGNPSITQSYFISTYYFSFPNIKYFYSMKNLQLYYRICTGYPQALIENIDPSRLIVLYPRMAAVMPPDVSGNYQIELWPASNVTQAYPFLAYTQSPQLSNDTDNFPAFCRTDAIISYATAQAFMYKTKNNANYSESVAVVLSERKMKEFEMRYASAAAADENLFRADIQLKAEMQMPVIDMYTGELRYANSPWYFMASASKARAASCAVRNRPILLLTPLILISALHGLSLLPS
jgi:hypothetical protein